MFEHVIRRPLLLLTVLRNARSPVHVRFYETAMVVVVYLVHEIVHISAKNGANTPRGVHKISLKTGAPSGVRSVYPGGYLEVK